MKKKLFQLLLGVLITFPTFAREFTYPYEGQTLTYTVVDEEAKSVRTKSYNKVSGNFVLPEHPMDGGVEYTLIRIEESAFYDCKSRSVRRRTDPD